MHIFLHEPVGKQNLHAVLGKQEHPSTRIASKILHSNLGHASLFQYVFVLSFKITMRNYEKIHNEYLIRTIFLHI